MGRLAQQRRGVDKPESRKQREPADKSPAAADRQLLPVGTRSGVVDKQRPEAVAGRSRRAALPAAAEPAAVRAVLAVAALAAELALAPGAMHSATIRPLP